MTLNLNEILMKLPLASSAFLAYAIVGAIMLLSGTLEYGSFSTNLLAIGVACGAIGLPRAASKLAEGTTSVNFLGFIESLPIPTLVFVVFLIASSVALAMNIITFGEFSDNIWKVGIACGVLQATRAVEKVFEPAVPPAISA
jgi:hypothetical protein